MKSTIIIKMIDILLYFLPKTVDIYFFVCIMGGMETLYHRGLSDNFEFIRKENREFYDGWVKDLDRINRSPNTIQQYTSTMRIFLSWNYSEKGDKLFVDLLNRDFADFIYYQRKIQKVSTRRLNFYKSALNSMSKYIERAYEETYPGFKNKAQNIESFSQVARREKIIIGSAELEHMLSTLVNMKKYQLACWLAFLAYSGCRRSEGVQMKVEWFTEKYEKFAKPYTMYKTPPIKTKGRGEEGKIIPKFIFKDGFKPYFDLWMKERERLGIQSEWLFLSNYKWEWNQATASTVTCFANEIKDIFNNGFHNHCMRHYFATMLRGKHFPNSIILKIVKWEDESMINNYDDTEDDDAIEDYFNSLIHKQENPNETNSKAEILDQLRVLDVNRLNELLKMALQSV